MKRKAISLISFILCLAMLFGIGSVSYAASNFTTKSQFTGKSYTHYASYAGTMVKDMIDVSEHNGLINWYKIKALGIDDAIIRVGYRGYGQAGTMREDNYFYDNMAGAQKAGVNIGVYFYSQALNTTEAIAEANFVLKRIKAYKLQLPVFFDYEFAEVSDGRLDYAWSSGKLNKTKMTNNVIAFCDTIKKAGFKAGIYSSSGFYTYQYNADTFLNKGYEFWNAYYTINSTSGSFWPNKNHVYKYWQYGGDNVQGCCGEPTVAWLKVTYGSYTGYVSAQSVNFTAATKGTSLVSGLNVRKGAGSGYGVITTIPKGGKMTIHSYPTYTNTDLNFYYYVGSLAKPNFTLTPGQNSIKVSWSAVAGAASYRVYLYKGNGSYERVAETSATSYTVSGLKGNTKYTLLVRAFSGSVGSKYTTDDNKSAVTLPDKPALKVSDASETSLQFTWNKVGGAAYYRVYSYDTKAKQYTRLAQLTTPGYTLSGLESGSSNYLLARAFTADGTGSSYTVNDVKCFHSVPVQPQLSLARYSYSIKLSWNKVEGADFYRIYEYDAASGKYTRLANVTDTAWEHGHLEGNSEHTYLVRAMIEGGWGSAFTAADRKTTTTRLAKPQFLLAAESSNTVRVAWEAVEGAAYYKVFLYNAGTGKYTTLTKTDLQEYVYTKAKGGCQYRILVRAYTAEGDGSSYSVANQKSIITPIHKAVFTLASNTKGTVDVKWQAVSDAAFYRVYSYNKATGKYQRLAQVTATSYRLSKLASGKQYTYLVRAFSAEGYAADYTIKDNKTITVK
ncbi:MAG: hypothetical protein IJI67_05070 [Clostridia bacterium]|nr:hypothetical protein [Clostridia bacterium]